MVTFPGFRVLTLPPSTVATEASDVLQLTEGSVASSGLTVADKVVSSPSTNVKACSFIETEVTGINRLSTVITHASVFSPAWAVIVTFPGFKVLTLPPSTVATVASDVVQLTEGSVASSGLTVAVSVVSSPSTNVKACSFSTTEVTGMNRFSTVTTQESTCSPACALMTARPGAKAFTWPSATVATEASEVVQVTEGSVASSGRTAAFKSALSPSTSVKVCLSSSTEETGINLFSTVTAQVAVFSPACAVIVTVPGATAVTFPSATVATDSSEVVQVTVGSVAFSGRTVAFKSASFPSTRVISVISRVTDSTSTSGTPAWLTVNLCTSLPQVRVTTASLSAFPSLGRADTVIVTAPAFPPVGSTESQAEAFVSAISALQAAVAVNFT